MAMFMPINWSVTAGPLVDRSTDTEVATVTVVVEVIAAPTGGVTVRVYVVVVVGLTETPVPLVTSIEPEVPPVMTPVPLAKTPVRVELPPEAMVAGRAPKLVMVGSGFTMMV